MGDKLTKEVWYHRPAESWPEGLPIGNGRIGGMTECGINRDHMYLNEETVWAGHPDDCFRTDARQAMQKLRDLLFQEAPADTVTTLVKDQILPQKRWFGSYQLLGELTIRSFQTVEYNRYQRKLDLETGIVKAVIEAEPEQEKKVTYHKEYFVSASHQVIAIRYSGDGTAGFDLDITLTRERDAKTSPAGPDGLVLAGQCQGDGIRFAGMMKVVLHGGSSEVFYIRPEADPSLRVYGARTVDIYVAARTDFNCPDYSRQCRLDAEGAAAIGYDEIKRQHIREYQDYYGRFDLGFAEGCREKLKGYSTYERLRAIRSGEQDENFYALLVNYYRYLLLSSSRPGCLPSNLQGLWNYQIFAPWESDYHANVNLQANYWPCEGYHLSECHEPLFDWMERAAQSGRITADAYYGAGGWVLHHASNVFAHTAPSAVPAGLWPLGAAWLVRHLYEHYLYNGDALFLKERAYPLMKGAAEFLLDFLAVVPEGMEGAGLLVTNPSHSPENSFYLKTGAAAVFTYGATMDFEIIHDLFGNCLAAAGVLKLEYGISDAVFEQRLRTALEKIPPVKISEKNGTIQEWFHDYDAVDPGHRHMSHLYGVFPGRSISLMDTPRLAAAAKETLNQKLAGDYDGQGWSYGWMSCLWARLGEPQKAYEALNRIVKEHMLHNLFLEAHLNPQVGDGQSIPAAVLEMLVWFDGQSLHLLSSLPAQWQDGWVRGLRAIGGYVLDMTWKNAVIETLTIDTNKVFCAYPLVFADQQHYQQVEEAEGIIRYIRKEN